VRVCLFPVDNWGVGSYRCLFPGRELALHGHEVTIPRGELKDGKPVDGPIPLAVSRNPDGSIPDWLDADVYVFQRRMEHRLLHGAWSMADVARWLREHGKVIVSDVDDWMPGMSPSNPGYASLGKLSKHLSVTGLLDTFRASDCLTVSTPALAEGHARDCGDVRVLPNFLDWRMWDGVEQQSEVERPGGRVRVGWMGWLQWHPDDMNVLRGLIGPWLERNRHVDFVSIGEPKPGEEPDGYRSVHDVLDVPADRRLVVHGRRFAELARIVPNLDVGLVPLAGSVFNECKSHLKGLEYSAAGIVPVASPTEPYRSFIRDGETGFLARKPKQWLRVMDELVNDDGLRRRVGRAAREAAAANTIQEHYGLWEETYAGLASSALVDDGHVHAAA
jgi:glycosyltransferase involved in cell wall biosynthesis